MFAKTEYFSIAKELIEIDFTEKPLLIYFLGMLVHGSKATLDRRRMGFTAQYCQTCVEMVPMNYTKSVAFTEDFRKPVLLSGEDNFGRLNYFKTKEQMLDQANFV